MNDAGHRLFRTQAKYIIIFLQDQNFTYEIVPIYHDDSHFKFIYTLSAGWRLGDGLLYIT